MGIPTYSSWHAATHSQKEQRFICPECHKTFSARKGTGFYRLRTSAETVAIVVTLLAHGCPLQAIVAACGFDERTVADWWARSGRQGQAMQEYSSNNRGTWDKCKPMSAASSNRVASSVWRWP